MSWFSCSFFGWVSSWVAGVRDKVKPKFSLRIKSHKVGLSGPLTSKDEDVMSSKVLDEPEQLEPIEDEAVEKSNLEFLEDFHGQTEWLNLFPKEGI